MTATSKTRTQARKTASASAAGASEDGAVPAGRWVVIDGRRWRASDPSIPPRLRAELVAELMDARRAVGAARRDNAEQAESKARRRVHEAKVALGERGEPWWNPLTAAARRRRLEAAILTLARHRAPAGSCCPSDAARAVGGSGWRALMPVTREVTRDLAIAGAVEVRQGGQVVRPHEWWRGPVRISVPRSRE